MKWIIGVDPGAPCPRPGCGRIHSVASQYDEAGRLVSWEHDRFEPCRGWRRRIARALAEALARLSEVVAGQ